MNAQSELFYFDDQELIKVANRFKGRYAVAKPFPHIVIDGFLPPSVADGILAEFPAPGQIKWHTFNDPDQIKLACNDTTQMGPFTRHVLSQFNSASFVNFLETLTGISGLVPDPHFEGGGLHQIKRTGLLRVHADFNHHPRMKLDRRLNALLYLNKDWRDEYRGHFELWDHDMKKCEVKVAPLFNRFVVFTTTDFSYHGHPDPLTCPDGMTRKSIALYYYSNGRPVEEVSEGHTTLFQDRPTDRKSKAKKFIKSLVPPIMVDAVRAVKRP